MRYAKVIIDLSSREVDKCFTYSIPEDMQINEGDLVRVPFGHRHIEGFVAEITETSEIDPEKLKPINEKVTESIILPELIELAAYMRRKYSCTSADALRVMIPPQLRGSKVREKKIKIAELASDAETAQSSCKKAGLQSEVIRLLEQGAMPLGDIEKAIRGGGAACRALAKKQLVVIKDSAVRRAPAIDEGGRSCFDPVLTAEQSCAANELVNAIGSGERFLLYGVTGSGKTEVYIKLIRELLARGKSAIILVPEIALTPQTVGWFHARFGELSAVLHSRLSPGERYDEWQRIKNGEAKVVIGARSAVFAPVEAPGAIIIDEEHEGAYISEKHPRYDARDIAAERIRISKGVLVLGSATPSIASFMRTRPQIRPENRLKLLELNQRVLGRSLPECCIADMRTELAEGNKSIFSAKLQRALRECMDDGKQAMLFINRRGHSTFVSCRACGHTVKCEKCDVALTYHQNEQLLICHYCGAASKPPAVCPSCGSRYIKYFGAGTQKIEAEARRLFPDRRILRMDMDTTGEKDAHARILETFRRGDADILVGTQMIAKGLDFPDVTLVGVVAADTTLNLPDYRSAERTFQLITQVAGRAGRADSPGKVVIQTYTPEHYAIKCALKQDYRAFYSMEAAYRKKSLYPPYTTLCRLVFSSGDADEAANAASQALKELKDKLDEQKLTRDILSINPGPAPIKRLRGEARYQILLKAYTAGNVTAVERIMEELSGQGTRKVNIDFEINPANMF